ncbi:dnaJ homolog subfamily B member 13-like isoform X2 [Polypterus senegalus]|uniref:dnaJ homolog subfamily B member 13-like isoform X2 n=1 Tax=Polypterus senegalus TaxID=55291 RepID=UPI001963FD9F|nr:dnaJ homolog subfamily B member 13-like isoform X2 [Polypterus senegalus]
MWNKENAQTWHMIIMEITKNVNNEEIKRVYHRLALMFLPQKEQDLGVLEKFAELVEAYDILNDYFSIEKEDNLTTEFDGKKKRDPPIVRDLYLSLEELFYGCTKKIRISRRVLNEDGVTTCYRNRILVVDIQPGWKEGTRITFPEEGDQGPNNIPADIVFIVKEKPHPRFRRAQNDLVYKTHIDLGKGLTGFSVEIETLDSRLLNIPINDIVHPNYAKIVTGEGMPLSKDPAQKGNLIIRFEILFPHRILAEKKQLIKQALLL